jgi:hypothetical protein
VPVNSAIEKVQLDDHGLRPATGKNMRPCLKKDWVCGSSGRVSASKVKALNSNPIGWEGQEGRAETGERRGEREKLLSFFSDLKYLSVTYMRGTRWADHRIPFSYSSNIAALKSKYSLAPSLPINKY